MLVAEEGSIAAATAQQLVMPSTLDDLAAFDHQDGVGMHDGVQPVGDDDRGPILTFASPMGRRRSGAAGHKRVKTTRFFPLNPEIV